MKLTPLDIKRHQFEKGFRGYDPDEVDGFLKQVADRFEALLEEVRLAQEKTRETEAKLVHYERVELALQEALESAKETARRSEEDAERRAAVIIEEAELRAQQITQEAERERFGMKKDLVKLSARQAEVAARLRGFLMSELQIVSDFQGEDRHGLLQLDDGPDLLLDAPADAGAPAADAEPDADAVEADDTEGTASADDVDAYGDQADGELTQPADSDADRVDSVLDADEAGDVTDDPVVFESSSVAELQPDASAAGDDVAFEPVVEEAEVLPSDEAEPRDHVVLTSPAEPEPLAPSESEVVGPSRPVKPARMPADPWAIPSPSVAGSDAERERIRRILEDLD